MDKIPFYQHFIVSMIACIGFAIYLSVPKKDLLISGAIGGIGWLFYIILFTVSGNIVMPFFLATLVIGMLANYFAKKNKKATIVYMIPGIIPLVPGLNMYYTMFYIVTKKYNLAMQNATQALMIAFALSSALILTKSVGRITDTVIEKRKNKIKRSTNAK